MKNKFKQISLDQAYNIIKRPITTEKSTNLQQFNQYSFIVSKNSNTFEIKSFKTKELHSDLKHFDYKSALFIYSESGVDKNFKLASSNIPKVSILSQKGINVKDLISFDKIFIEQKSLNEITKRLS